jgi:peptidyl-prolyl cis-trans isomerase B (cyclophilin B)
MQRTLAGLAAILSILILGSGFALQKTAKLDKRPRVEIRTELGNIVVELYHETPQHRDNFLKLVNEHYYDSLLWHRIIPAFMVQGGDPNSKRAAPGTSLGTGGPGYTVPAEIVPGLIHKKGALAAARQSDQVNPTRASSGSQFYIVQGKTFTEQELDMIAKRSASMGSSVTYTPEQKQIYATLGGAPHLDGAYTIFGEVIKGLEVIDLLAAVERLPGDRPVKDVHMWMHVVK